MIEYTNSVTVRPWFVLLRDGGTLMELIPSGSPSLVSKSSDKLKMSFRGKFRDPGDTVQWAKDRLQIGIDIGGNTYPLGNYMVTTVSKSHEASGDYVSIQAYSILYLASRQKLGTRYFAAAGKRYLAAVREVFSMAGLDDVETDACDTVLPIDREWEEGTALLDIANELLAEIGFRQAYPDMRGVIQIRKRKEPIPENVTMVYRSGEYSVLFEAYTMEQDGFDKPNVFRYICANPEMGTELVAEAVNEDPKSPFSVTSVGERLVEITRVDNVPDLAALQEMADTRMMESRKSALGLRFTSAIQPEHGVFDILHLDHGGASGIYEETEWTMQLSASGKMTHRAERVIFA